MNKENIFENNEPLIVRSHELTLDAEYAEWIAEVKHRYRSAQTKAAVKVNGEKLLFNWQMGRDLSQKKAEERWGAGVVEQVSLDLRREFPKEDGFSARNLRYMKQWRSGQVYGSGQPFHVHPGVRELIQLSVHQQL